MICFSLPLNLCPPPLLLWPPAMDLGVFCCHRSVTKCNVFGPVIHSAVVNSYRFPFLPPLLPLYLLTSAENRNACNLAASGERTTRVLAWMWTPEQTYRSILELCCCGCYWISMGSFDVATCVVVCSPPCRQCLAVDLLRCVGLWGEGNMVSLALRSQRRLRGVGARRNIIISIAFAVVSALPCLEVKMRWIVKSVYL